MKNKNLIFVFVIVLMIFLVGTVYANAPCIEEWIDGQQKTEKAFGGCEKCCGQANTNSERDDCEFGWFSHESSGNYFTASWQINKNGNGEGKCGELCNWMVRGGSSQSGCEPTTPDSGGKTYDLCTSVCCSGDPNNPGPWLTLKEETVGQQRISVASEKCCNHPLDDEWYKCKIGKSCCYGDEGKKLCCRESDLENNDYGQACNEEEQKCEEICPPGERSLKKSFSKLIYADYDNPSYSFKTKLFLFKKNKEKEINWSEFISCKFPFDFNCGIGCHKFLNKAKEKIEIEPLDITTTGDCSGSDSNSLTEKGSGPTIEKAKSKAQLKLMKSLNNAIKYSIDCDSGCGKKLETNVDAFDIKIEEDPAGYTASITAHWTVYCVNSKKPEKNKVTLSFEGSKYCKK
jgi:hypothetical protein